MPRLTIEWLKRNRACKEWVILFDLKFPDGIDIDPTNRDDIKTMIDAGFGPYLFWPYTATSYDGWAIRLPGQDLRDLNFKSAGVYGSDFSNADLSGVDMSLSHFWFVNFAGANLSMADMEMAIFENCSFAGANLDGVNLKNASAMQCDFKDASMKRAALINTQFYNCESIETCDVAGARYTDNTRLDGYECVPLNWDAAVRIDG